MPVPSSYVHTSTILRLETMVEPGVYFDDTEGGLQTAKVAFQEARDHMMTRSPFRVDLEDVKLVRVRAGYLPDEDVLLAIDDSAIGVQHSKRKQTPCVYWWKAHPLITFQEDDCNC